MTGSTAPGVDLPADLPAAAPTAAPTAPPAALPADPDVAVAHAKACGCGAEPSWPVRMVASDLDGTLIRRDGTVSARTVAALADCRAAGVDVVAVTGRPSRWLTGLAEVVGQATAICANGALVFDLATGRPVRVHTMTPAAVLDAVRALRARLPGVAVAMETLRAAFLHEPAYVPRFDPTRRSTVGRLEDLLREDPGVLKLLVKHEGASSDVVLSVARDVLTGIAEPTHSGAGHGLVEISALGVSKASTLAELAAERGVAPGAVAAFGDMPNDVAMLCWAGHSYAMADGHPDVIAVAAGTAPPCEQDGVARVLEEIVLHRRPQESATHHLS